jgi:peptide/histidine transporter 3/4
MWFHIEPAGANPYKLVYKVFKFAYQLKVPLKRGAFTYCEDESPSRMDLGKQKYGGPYTTKQVEDVKAFLGILKVLICIASAFMLQTVIQ